MNHSLMLRPSDVVYGISPNTNTFPVRYLPPRKDRNMVHCFYACGVATWGCILMRGISLEYVSHIAGL